MRRSFGARVAARLLSGAWGDRGGAAVTPAPAVGLVRVLQPGPAVAVAAARTGPSVRALRSRLRMLGALALVVVGGVHLEQYAAGLSAIPVIGPLFVLNFAGAAIVALALLAPTERMAGRWAGIWLGLLALSGVSMALVALVFVLVSEYVPLFGVFMENGYRPEVVAATVAEIATTVLLGGFIATVIVRGRSGVPVR
jgi:hypothetical protein